MTSTQHQATVIEVYADVTCPFTHVGLRRLVQLRAERGREDVVLRVRSWPLEIVNGAPLDPALIAAEVDEIRTQVAPDLFSGFRTEAMPDSSLPALSLAVAAYRDDVLLGEAVSLELRDALFEQGRDISDPAVLADIARTFDVSVRPSDVDQVLFEYAEGTRRGVIGSPHFFTPTGDYFCPSLDVHRDDHQHLVVAFDPTGATRLLDACTD